MCALRIVIAGEIFSQNLGDGIIYECLRFLFQRQLPRVEIIPLDISGRSVWVEPTKKQTLRLIAQSRIRNNAPAVHSLLNLVHLHRLYNKHLHKEWSSIIQDADLIVIGGGKLLMDNHLDFPFKLSHIAHLANQFSKPVHFISCGVGEKWSDAARRMLNSALTDARTITLRDRTSQSNLYKNFPTVSSSVSFDPAIWASEVYPCQSTQFDNVIGLGLINSADVNLYLSPDQQLSEQSLTDIFCTIIDGLIQNGLGCELFTNGSASDASFSNNLAAKLKNRHYPHVQFAPHPGRPSQLADLISRYAGVIACRLHANLVALSSQKPTQGLAWDNKIGALYEQIGRPQYVQRFTDLDVTLFVNQMATLLQNKTNLYDIEPFKEAISSNVALILDSVNE